MLMLRWPLSKLPSPDQVEKPFKTVKLILWNFFELILLVIAMVAIGAQALEHIPPFRSLFDPPPVRGERVPPDPSPNQPPVPATRILQDQPAVTPPRQKLRRRASRVNVPVALELVTSVKPVSAMGEAGGGESTALDTETEPPPTQKLAVEYVAEGLTDKPRSKVFVRVIKAPAHAIRWFARGVAAGFRSQQP
jgi:hypothetical protein